ncbi:beta-hydroxyacyl-ACP dehydratase [Janthinobacterium fluminis]|uniref:Beta-hydroxyacyl-ACP dehydratase n=1 Tax=Janthinobacterium fluminis TaxID=2987524 RepID=A0ABT5K3F9_9BURK|nr:beta-hydroxyacyl-ACP dehydratase [Janthinobacterium fluminis]MDC8758938.1 beta-hydroxyacyl-ACP dehydratase [Janthinobacterium fluminis]
MTSPLLCDTHLHVDGEQARDLLLVSGSDIFALGHYPGNPIYPGVLIAERLCALAAALAGAQFGGVAHVGAIKRIQYLDAILPGDVVELSASLKRAEGGRLDIVAAATVAGKAKTRATLICQAGPMPACAPAALESPVPGAQRIEHRQLAKLLPHRYPFLLVDRIEHYTSGQTVLATKLLNRASPLFLDARPASYPHGLMVESIGQAGIALFFLSGQQDEPQDIVLGSVVDASFEAQIPFDVAVTLEARIERLLPNGVVFSGLARVGEQVLTRVGSMIAMIDPR